MNAFEFDQAVDPEIVAHPRSKSRLELRTEGRPGQWIVTDSPEVAQR